MIEVRKNSNRFGAIVALAAAGSVAFGISAATAQVAFDPPVNFSGGDGMRSVISVDLNGDGIPDLATADKSGGTASVFLSNGDGTFAGQAAYPVGPLGSFPFDLTAADFDGDGFPDLAVANAGSNGISILLSDGVGDGTFVAGGDYGVGIEPTGIAAGDFDGDGDTDIAVANLGSSSVTILMNNGDGTFSRVSDFLVGPEPNSIVAEDLDNNGTIDLAVLNGGDQFEFISAVEIRRFGTVSVMLNDGFGGFAAQTRFEVTAFPTQMIAADLNSDGFLDLASGNSFGATTEPFSWISVIMNDRLGGFLAEQKVGTAGRSTTVAAADLNGDGRLDLVASNRSVANQFEVMVNNGDGTFGAPQVFPIGAMNGAQRVTTGDYDGDGDEDVVLASSFSDSFGLNRNQLVANPPVVVGTPDLVATIDKIKAREKNGEFEFQFEAVIENIGDGPTPVAVFGIRAYLSVDAVLDDTLDTLLTSGVLSGGLVAGQAEKFKGRLLLSEDPSGKYLFVSADHSNFVEESDETNNVDGAAIN